MTYTYFEVKTAKEAKGIADEMSTPKLVSTFKKRLEATASTGDSYYELYSYDEDELTSSVEYQFAEKEEGLTTNITYEDGYYTLTISWDKKPQFMVSEFVRMLQQKSFLWSLTYKEGGSDLLRTALSEISKSAGQGLYEVVLPAKEEDASTVIQTTEALNMLGYTVAIVTMGELSLRISWENVQKGCVL